jgi:hypothetical protein
MVLLMMQLSIFRIYASKCEQPIVIAHVLSGMIDDDIEVDARVWEQIPFLNQRSRD